jgi:ATP-dependent DNA helicase 2 subunit 2
MESVIKDVITKSYADTSYDKAIKALQAYRSEAIDVRLFVTVLMIFQLDEPRQFNEYLQSLKEDLLAGKLNGNRRDFWNRMKSEKIGLITFEESEVDQIEGIGESDVKKVILRYDAS